MQVVSVTAWKCALSFINIHTHKKSSCDASEYILHHSSLTQETELKMFTLPGHNECHIFIPTLVMRVRAKSFHFLSSCYS